MNDLKKTLTQRSPNLEPETILFTVLVMLLSFGYIVHTWP